MKGRKKAILATGSRFDALFWCFCVRRARFGNVAGISKRSNKNQSREDILFHFQILYVKTLAKIIQCI